MAINTTINKDGREDVHKGGVATNTTINPGGTLDVSGDASMVSITGDTFGGGGGSDRTVENVRDGSQTHFVTLDLASELNVFKGGSADHITVKNSIASSNSPELNIRGHASFITVEGVHNSADVNVLAGGTADHITLNQAGFEEVRNGGTSDLTTINLGGREAVVGGQVTNTTINGGVLDVFHGGIHRHDDPQRLPNRRSKKQRPTRLGRKHHVCWDSSWRCGTSHASGINGDYYRLAGR
jgi:autotransporter passenger strand-loop-strand repeat protein